MQLSYAGDCRGARAPTTDAPPNLVSHGLTFLLESTGPSRDGSGALASFAQACVTY